MWSHSGTEGCSVSQLSAAAETGVIKALKPPPPMPNRTLWEDTKVHSHDLEHTACWEALRPALPL